MRGSRSMVRDVSRGTVVFDAGSPNEQSRGAAAALSANVAEAGGAVNVRRRTGRDARSSSTIHCQLSLSSRRRAPARVVGSNVPALSYTTSTPIWYGSVQPATSYGRSPALAGQRCTSSRSRACAAYGWSSRTIHAPATLSTSTAPRRSTRTSSAAAPASACTRGITYRCPVPRATMSRATACVVVTNASRCVLASCTSAVPATSS